MEKPLKEYLNHMFARIMNTLNTRLNMQDSYPIEKIKEDVFNEGDQLIEFLTKEKEFKIWLKEIITIQESKVMKLTAHIKELKKWL